MLKGGEYKYFVNLVTDQLVTPGRVTVTLGTRTSRTRRERGEG
jgi:hypothetical protein